MNREELINLVRKIQSAEGTEEEIDKMIEEFLKNVSDPNAVNYIFEKEYENLSVEEIVDKAMSYKSFNL